MTINEAKAAKAVLEDTIAIALRKFTADTGVAVVGVNVDSCIVLGGPPAYRVEVESRL